MWWTGWSFPCSASYPYFMKWGSPQTELLQSPSPADDKAGLLRHQHWQYYGWRYRKDPNRPESGSYDSRHGVPCRHFEPRLSVPLAGKDRCCFRRQKIYMTAYEAGDEAFLMAKQLPGIPVVIGKERAITGQYAVDKFKAEVIILDDGYQHWQLHRDLDVVPVDTLNMFGNGSILPRGTLREPLKNLSRADLFLLTKCDQSSPISWATLCDQLHRYKPNAPIVESIHKPCAFIEIADWYKNDGSKALPLRHSKGQEVMVFSAIGNPSSFEQTMAGEGLQIAEAIRYPDHHDYGMVEMQYIMERAISKRVTALVTTGKDAVKIPTEFIYLHREVPSMS